MSRRRARTAAEKCGASGGETGNAKEAVIDGLFHFLP